MIETELRERVCAKARSWLGRREADGSHREIIDVYNQIRPRPRGYRLRYTDPWCAGFVSAVAETLGLTAWIFPECGCGPMIDSYRRAGRWMEDDAWLPTPGDLIFYDWEDIGTGDNRGNADHVGIVDAVDGERITVIEGNCGKIVATREIRRDGRNIRGYGLPDYEAAAAAITKEEGSRTSGSRETEAAPGPAAEEEAQQKEGAELCAVPLPLLQQGDAGEAVWAAQMLLQGRGFPVGATGCDGEFGPRTGSALRRFQLARELECDGVLGRESWRALIGGKT